MSDYHPESPAVIAPHPSGQHITGQEKSGKLPGVLKWTITGLVAILVTLYAVAYFITANLSATTHGSVNLNFGNVPVPSERTLDWAASSALLESMTLGNAEKHSNALGFGKLECNHLVEQLAAGQNIGPVNTILKRAKPWGKVGSPYDYDFTLCVLTVMLYNYGDRPDVLYPETVEHIVNELMTEKGGDPVVRPPWLHGLLPARDTENHILMTEGSRYLTNQWIAQHGNPDPIYNNTQNGLEAFLLGYLQGLERAGLYEYNARPYVAYTLRSLLNIASFADGPVRDASVRILDRINWDYALGSLSLRRFPPFRRRPEYAREVKLDTDGHTAMMKGWMSLAGVDGSALRDGVGWHAMWVELTSYRPPDAVVRWVMSKPAEYVVQIGHGIDGSPEIYSGGPGYLITAGGVANDLLGDCVARPTTLMLNDDATDLKELLHMAGPGSARRNWSNTMAQVAQIISAKANELRARRRNNTAAQAARTTSGNHGSAIAYRNWNNTGVHRRFAVSAGPVSVPEGWSPLITDRGWSFFERSGQRIAVYSSDDLGIFCLLPEGDLSNQAQLLVNANGDVQVLKTEFRWPAGPVLTYDVFADKDEWVMRSVDGKPVDRRHGEWPLMKGELPGVK